MATNINTFYPIEDTSRTTQINPNRPNTPVSEISQLVEPFFNKIKEMSTKHLGNPTYLLVNQEDTVAKKVLKISSWLLGISLAILLVAYVYDHLLDLYHQHFENYSRMDEYHEEISKNTESPIQFPKDQSARVKHLPEYTIPKIQKPSIPINADDDISDTKAQTDVNSDLGEKDFEPVFEEKIATDDSTKISATSLKPQEPTVDISIVERSKENDDIPNTIPDSLEDSFGKMDIIPKLVQEEMKNFLEIPSPRRGIGHRIMQLAKGIKAFWANNPFTSNKPNVTNTISSETKHKKPSYEDLKMLHPIIEAYENPKICTIAENIEQIKVDLPRMKIFANGIHCVNIQDFMNRLGLTLNEDETDVLPRDNTVIPKILSLSQQRSLNFSHGVLAKHWQHLNVIPMMARIEGRRPIVRVNWNPEFPEQCEITGETLFHILSVNDSTFLPYLCKVEIKHSLDKAEVSWEILEEPSSKPVAHSQAIEESEQSKPTPASSNDEDFEIFEENSEDTSNTNYNWDIAFNHLLNKPDTCLNSTVTSEYLKSLKTKHSTFVYEDRLMLPGSITTEEIVNFLNKLKNNDPINQTIFLPFLVKGWTVDHAVVAVINLADEIIEYFDPKGQSSIWPVKVEKQSNKNVFDFLTELGQKLISPSFSKEKIVYNKKNVPQRFSDDTNCGVFCLQFIEKRITRPFNDIESDLIVDPKELRRQLAKKLVENTHSNSI